MVLPKSWRWSTTLRHLGPGLALYGVFSLGVAFVHRAGAVPIAIPGFPVAVFAASTGIFLGFRNNSAYDRWWEARGLWGAIVNHSRSLVRLARELGDEALGRETARWAVAFAHATRLHLRRQPTEPEMARILGSEAELVCNRNDVPAATLQMVSRAARRASDEGRFSEFRLVAFEGILRDLTNALGGCERIKNTPMLRVYDVIPRALVVALLTLAPFALVSALGMGLPLAMGLLSFLFLSLESIGRIVETPFECEINDIPMTAIATALEADLLQHVGRTDLPSPVEPVDGFLY